MMKNANKTETLGRGQMVELLEAYRVTGSYYGAAFTGVAYRDHSGWQVLADTPFDLNGSERDGCFLFYGDLKHHSSLTVVEPLGQITYTEARAALLGA